MTKAVKLGDDPRWHLVDSLASDRTACGERTAKILTGMGGEDMVDCLECLIPGGLPEPASCDPPMPEAVTIMMNDVTSTFQVPAELVNDRMRVSKMREEWTEATLSGFCAQQGRTADQVEKEAESGAIVGVLIALAAAMVGVAFLVSWITEVLQ